MGEHLFLTDSAVWPDGARQRVGFYISAVHISEAQGINIYSMIPTKFGPDFVGLRWLPAVFRLFSIYPRWLDNFRHNTVKLCRETTINLRSIGWGRFRLRLPYFSPFLCRNSSLPRSEIRISTVDFLRYPRQITWYKDKLRFHNSPTKNGWATPMLY